MEGQFKPLDLFVLERAHKNQVGVLQSEPIVHGLQLVDLIKIDQIDPGGRAVGVLPHLTHLVLHGTHRRLLVLKGDPQLVNLLIVVVDDLPVLPLRLRQQLILHEDIA